MLTIVHPTADRTIVRIAPAHTAVVSWNTAAQSGRLEITVYRADGQVSSWLPYVAFSPGSRRSLSGRDEVARIATDIVESTVPMVAIEIRSDVPLDAIAVSTPVHRRSSEPATVRTALDVPALSQYLIAHPEERGWCTPTSLAMLLAYWGKPHDIPQIVRNVYDDGYGGTGNWTFNMAYAGRFGQRAHAKDGAISTDIRQQFRPGRRHDAEESGAVLEADMGRGFNRCPPSDTTVRPRITSASAASELQMCMCKVLAVLPRQYPIHPASPRATQAGTSD